MGTRCWVARSKLCNSHHARRRRDYKSYVDQFIEFAKEHTELFFYVTRIGCGIAGFKDSDIAPLFKESIGIKNICLRKSFYP